MRALPGPALAVLLSACLAGPEVGVAIPGGGVPPLEPRLSSLQTLVFTPRCATSACHAGGNGTPLSLVGGETWANVVSVPAEQAPDLALVSPGEPSRSYLVLKLRGTHEAAGGYGTSMPPNGDPLSGEERQAIEDWITFGAADD